MNQKAEITRISNIIARKLKNLRNHSRSLPKAILASPFALNHYPLLGVSTLRFLAKSGLKELLQPIPYYSLEKAKSQHNRMQGDQLLELKQNQDYLRQIDSHKKKQKIMCQHFRTRNKLKAL